MSRRNFYVPRCLLSAMLLAALLALAGCINLPRSGDRGRVRMEVLEEAEGFWVRDQVLLLPLEGLVAEGDMRSYIGGPGMLVELRDRLDAARTNRRIKAVVLRISSPGGTVTASDLIHHEIVRFKEETGLPVVALLGDVAASGGFFIAMAADEVYALPTTLTGSIGVIATLPDLRGLGQKIGLQMRMIKSGEMKDIGSPWSELEPAEREVLQSIVQNHYQQFLDRILAGRADAGLTMERLAPLADGRVFGPEAAREAGLIDGVMYPEEVVERARELAGLPAAALVSYEYEGTWRGHIYARMDAAAPAAAGQVNLLNFDFGEALEQLVGARFLYLWMP